MPALNSTQHTHLAEIFTWVNFCRVNSTGQADKVTLTVIFTSCKVPKISRRPAKVSARSCQPILLIGWRGGCNPQMWA